MAHSTFYHRIKSGKSKREHSAGRPVSWHSITLDGEIVSNQQVQEWICELIGGEGEYYGYKKLTATLHRNYNLVINHKKVYRLCRELDILMPQRKIKEKLLKKIAINRTVTASNTLWEADIKYGYIAGEHRFFLILAILDVYDRSVVDFHIGLSCEAADAVRTLQSALFKRQLFRQENKPVIRTDNGTQFTAWKFADGCQFFGVHHERIPTRTPNKNAHIESFNAILENECLRRQEFHTYAEAYGEVSEFIGRYNTRRIHSSLRYHTPAEAYNLLRQNRLQIKEIHA